LRARSAAHPPRILLAEDNPVNQEVALELLREAGLMVDVASDGQEALELAQTADYDLILMDVQMPRMDGLAATRALRRLGAYAATPILAMTANAFDEDRDNCLEAGMNDHVPKPVEPEALYATLEHWLPLGGRLAPSAAASLRPEPPPREASDWLDAVSAIPGLDSAVGLHGLRGNEEAYQRLLRHYAVEHGQDMARLREHCEAGRRDEARRVAHSLKGVAGVLGAHQVRALAAELEQAIRADRGKDKVRALAQRLEQEQARLAQAILAAVPPAGETGASPDEACLDSELDHLEYLLASDDLGSVDVLRRLGGDIARRHGRAPQEELRALTSAYDFQAALGLLRRMRACERDEASA
jgi:two-component system sensor histidine kinase/response regulator